MRIVLTGFEPFAGIDPNPSWAAVQLAAEKLRASGYDAVAVQLPVVFSEATTQVRELLANHRPDVFIATGVATGAKAIRLETLAVNDISARIPDNLGVQPKGEKVVVNGPENYPTTLPTSITDTWKGAGIPTELSTDAGRYVCNATFFALQDAANKAKNNELNWLTKSGFIHIPPTDIVPIETSAEAVELAALESMSK